MTQPAQDPSARAFRDALGQFPTGVTVITALGRDGHPVGLTVSSFNSVSLHPPLVLWSLARHQPVAHDLAACEVYAIQLLAEDQAPLSQHFARREGDRFVDLPTTAGEYGVPLLDGCCAWFECRNTQRHEGGDHIIFVGEVLRFDRAERPPLVFQAGAYRRLAAADG
jgi:3-hydroxy-9,10-secoandrosta-1,3,5(10)-triene-9,17-dione monooxygenase reductase component